MPINWEQVTSDPEYLKLQPSQRKSALEQLYAASVEPEARASGLNEAQMQQAKDQILQGADSSLYGLPGIVGKAKELASGAVAGLTKPLFGAANLAMGAVGIQKPSWYGEVEKGLTESITPLQKAGEFGGDVAALAIPWLGETAAVRGVATGAKALMGGLGKTALGGTVARAVSEVPALAAKVGLLELLNTEDGKQAYEAAKSMAWMDAGTPWGMPGPAMWGPLVGGLAAGKVFPGRTLVEGGGGTRQWSWADRRGLGEIIHEGVPKWIMKGILNSPPSAYRLGRDPEAAIVKEFGFFKEADVSIRGVAAKAKSMLHGGDQPLSQVGWKRLIRERINLLSNQVDDALRIAEEEGVGIHIQPVSDAFDEIETSLGQSLYGNVRDNWTRFFRDLRKGYTKIGTWDDLVSGNRYKTISVGQRQKIELGKNEAWYSEKGFIDDVSKMRRKLYHSMDVSIDDAVTRAREKLQQELAKGSTTPPVVRGQLNLPLGTKAAARPQVFLQERIAKLQNISDLNDRIANLLDAEHAITRTMKASRGDKAWFWFTRLGKAGALGGAVASLNYLVPSPGWGITGGLAGLAAFTPMGRSLMAKSYPMPYGLPIPGVPMMAAGIAKSPWTARAAGAAMTSGVMQQPQQQPAVDPDPLKLRQ